MRIYTEFILWTHGITYEQQGYRTVDGDLPARKIDEHLLVHRLYHEAPRPRK